MNEPHLRPEDHRAWAGWMRACMINRRTNAYRFAVDSARHIIETSLERGDGRRKSASLSGGKDSSALVHLASTITSDFDVITEKDDLDYPGEETYVRALANRCGFSPRLKILRPKISPVEWLEQRAGAMSGGEDMHGRGAGLSKACFYNVMAEAEQGYGVTFWGLRAEESRARAKLMQVRGCLYTLTTGVIRCHPLGHWRGIDVFTYLDENGIEPLHVYKCCGFLPHHRHNPALIRKSWWIPGVHAANGQASWLRHYYPSLFDRFRRWFPDANTFA